MIPRPLRSTLFPYTTLFRSADSSVGADTSAAALATLAGGISAAVASAATSVTSAEASTAVPSSVMASTTDPSSSATARSEEHTSELQSHSDLVCRLLLEKKN